MAAKPGAPRTDALLAWYFVTVWGVGFIATKAGLQHAAPFTFLTLRFTFGLLCLLPVLPWLKPRWPNTRVAWGHVVVAGLLMHAVHLSGSHYSQYTGLSAGVVAIILAAQPLLTAAIAVKWLGERPSPRQWLGIGIGLMGVALVVWHKININAMSMASFIAITTALLALTIGTLYQRRFLEDVDLFATAFAQFAVSLLVLAPLAWVVEGFEVRWSWQLLAAIAFLVIFASILAVSALHHLMRHREATRVSSILYLPPVFAVAAEWLVYDVLPTGLTFVGIVVVSIGVALAFSRKK